MELASQTSGRFSPLLDRALTAIHRRHQELAWTEDLVEHVEAAGIEGRLERDPRDVPDGGVEPGPDGVQTTLACHRPGR